MGLGKSSSAHMKPAMIWFMGARMASPLGLVNQLVAGFITPLKDLPKPGKRTYNRRKIHTCSRRPLQAGLRPSIVSSC